MRNGAHSLNECGMHPPDIMTEYPGGNELCELAIFVSTEKHARIIKEDIWHEAG